MRPLIYIISGNQGEGKTTFVKELAVILKREGFQCSGFYAEGFWNHYGRSRFDIVEINGVAREILCNTNPEKGDLQYRHFFFKPNALKYGNKILAKAAGSHSVTFIDEVGGLELENKGWAKAIDMLLLNPPMAMIWTVRTSFAAEVCYKFTITSESIHNISCTHPDRVLEELKEALNLNQF